ncbi:hypothetical protein [Nitrosovibrio tenuis]|uniref:Uncharacterized protein n=1 Tax=Nitrosovibrio tenuis TaxID=1233 RepID=A0A1H7FPM5_9PROT|nr:hypothetical protein [Nitrosovibrio tenuis]SEK28056.1 hypothetical protein SAMN05216387_10154 [Nitrosovibrio tenuis]
MIRTAILFSSHLLGETVLARLGKLRAEAPPGHDVFFYYDETKLRHSQVTRRAGGAIPHGSYDWSQYKRPCGYFPGKIPGNEDGMLLSAFHRLPGYDYYWYLEYDVVYSGHWEDFFSGFADNSADMLSTSITRHDQIPDWPLWKSLELPDGITLPSEKWLRSFNPILRLSRAALETLAAEYHQHAWAGHSECVMPTVLDYRGLRIEDIGGDGEFVPQGRENYFYRNNRMDKSLSPGTFVFRPAMAAPGSEPNLLWHPVKDPDHHTWDKASGLPAFLSTRLSALIKRNKLI